MRDVLLLAALLAVPVPALAQDSTDSSDETASEPTGPQRSNRLEFDARLVRGEAASGSVYLFKRQPRELPGLVPMRRSYRSRIVDPVLGDRSEPVEAPPAIPASRLPRSSGP